MVKYFCDRCDDEVRAPSELFRVSVAPQDEDKQALEVSRDVCEKCARQIHNDITTAPAVQEGHQPKRLNHSIPPRRR